MPGASPLGDTLDGVRKLEDAGAAAIVLHSLFQEQIDDGNSKRPYAEFRASIWEEALTEFQIQTSIILRPDDYLEHIRRVKEAVRIPVIASINGTRPGSWIDFCRLIAQAGADALELSVYYTSTDLFETGKTVEGNVVEAARLVKHVVGIPLAVKLTPFFSSLPNLARMLDDQGIDALVLFNRPYLPDIDLSRMEALPRLRLSDSSELPLRLLWLAVLAGRTGASLAASGGVHTSEDAIKAIAAGADAIQMVSALLRHGPQHLRVVREGIVRWLEERQFHDLRQVHRSMGLSRQPDPQAFARFRYAATLQGWKPSTSPAASD